MLEAVIATSETTFENALAGTQVDEYYDEILPESIKVNAEPPMENVTAAPNDKSSKDFTTAKGYVLNKLKDLKANPYPGLRPFKAFETNVFFGRSDITFNLITRLANHRFLVVLGASGTGKSSLVRAGVLSGIRALPGRQGIWKVVICRPGKNPFGNLAIAISKANLFPSCDVMDIWKKLSSSSYGYEELYNPNDTAKNFNTLIVIDQFEELFRYGKDAGANARNDASLFVKMLIDISKLKSLNTYVMITMRSEFLGDCVKFADLAEVINEGQFLIPRMKFRQLRDAIIQPGAFSGATVDRDFADKLIAEIGDNMDQLPVLQHALRRSYEIAKQKAARRNGIKVLYEDYKETGLLEKALDSHSNEIYLTLSDKQKIYCKILFQCITDRSTDGRGIRRPLSFSTIFRICVEGRQNQDPDARVRADVIKVIDSFRQESVNFLMPPPHVKITEETEIDISHESLMRVWIMLNKWIEEEAKDTNNLKELLKYGKNNFLKGSDLLIYDDWLKKKRPGFSWAMLYKPAEISIEEYRIKFDDAINLVERSRKNKLVKSILLFISASVIFLSMAAAFIMTFKNTALKTKNKELSAARDTLRFAKERIEKNRDSIRIASLKAAEDNVKLVKQQDSLSKQKDNILKQKDSLSKQQLVLSRQRDSILLKNERLENQTTLINKQKDSLNTANVFLKTATDSLRIVSDSATNLKNLALAIRHSEKSASIPFNDEKREDIKAYLALLSYQFYMKSQQEKDKRFQPRVYAALYAALRTSVSKDPGNKDTWKITSYKLSSDHLARASFSGLAGGHPDLYITAENKKLYSFDLKTTRTDSSLIPTGNKLVGVQAGSSGWIAINTLSNKLLLKNIPDPRKDTVFNLTGVVSTHKFSLDGTELLVYTRDSVISIINIQSKKVLAEKIQFRVEDVAFSLAHIYAITSTGSILIWNKKQPVFTSPVIVHNPIQEGSVSLATIGCDPNDNLVVWGNGKGQVFYMKNDLPKRAQYLTKFNGPITSIVFNSTLDLLAIASYDKTIQVINLPNLQSDVPLVLTNNEGPVTSVFFQKESSGKERLVALINPGIIRLYPMELETLACSLDKYYKGKEPSTDDKLMYIDKAIQNIKVQIKCK